MAEADVFSLENMDKFRAYVKDSGIYGRGTDVGKALYDLSTRQPPVLTDATTLIILSDTKTVDLNKALMALREAKRQAGRVIWLNPIPENKWQYLRSAKTIASQCTMFACNNLQALSNACRRFVNTIQ